MPNVCVLDMQPISPPIGGGRIRLLGLYHALGSSLPTTYVGTYDWPGEPYRDNQLSSTLREVTVPLSAEHFAAHDALRAKVGNRTIIDSNFHQLAHLSPDYVARAGQAVMESDIVVFSHPWIYPLVQKELQSTRPLVVYDSQNVEGMLRMNLLDDGGIGTGIAEEVVRLERQLCHEADLVLACSREDLIGFHELYGVPLEKLRLIPNGVFTEKIRPVSAVERAGFKSRLGIVHPHMALFMGSGYRFNVEAAEFIIKEIAPRLPSVLFVIAGGVGGWLETEFVASHPATNVRITGTISEEEKFAYLGACDVGTNPMFGGSGTNIKMFDFFAAGLPVVTTEIGARGIDESRQMAFLVARPENFVECINLLLHHPIVSRRMSAAARELATDLYSWERISANLGILLTRRRKYTTRASSVTARFGSNAQPVANAPASDQSPDREGGVAPNSAVSRGQTTRPRFSVIVPTYERHDHLDALIRTLEHQTEEDFEVIVVDQSRDAWPLRDAPTSLNLLYVHTPVRGVGKARNLGACFACGEVLAFTDDDCVPDPGWLRNARAYVDKPGVVGVEGFVRSDKLGDPDYRPVTNEGFTGIGFMTANLLVRADAFGRSGGFDTRFDNTPFREDTDLGWRLQQLGDIPFGRDVSVYHPPHLRTNQRESVAARVRFFEKDALLLRKYPSRYRELFFFECQWQQFPEFARNFYRGIAKHRAAIPEYAALVLRRRQC